LAQEPERDDFLEALAEVEKKAKQKRQKSLEDLDALFHQWFDLMFKYKNLLKLRALNR
jgi:hypothetical protein